MGHFRIRKEQRGYVVEEKVIKWSLFGLKTRWVPFVKTSGLDCAWHHKTFDFAVMNLVDELKNQMYGNC